MVPANPAKPQSIDWIVPPSKSKRLPQPARIQAGFINTTLNTWMNKTRSKLRAVRSFCAGKVNNRPKLIAKPTSLIWQPDNGRLSRNHHGPDDAPSSAANHRRTTSTANQTRPERSSNRLRCTSLCNVSAIEAAGKTALNSLAAAS